MLPLWHPSCKHKPLTTQLSLSGLSEVAVTHRYGQKYSTTARAWPGFGAAYKTQTEGILCLQGLRCSK